MKLLTLAILVIGAILGIYAADMVDQIVGDYAGTPDNHEALNFTSRFKRFSKTMQRFNATIQFKKPWPDSIYNVLTGYTFDHGMMRALFKRTYFNSCQIFTNEKMGMLYKTVHDYIPDFPTSCPIPAGTWYINNIEIPRYRKDWPLDLQVIIPPLVPETDKWRLDFENFDAKNHSLGIFRVEFRLLNEFMSQ